jgi:hypothetical protein
MRRLKELTRSTEPQIAELASIVLDAARVQPDKRRRFKFLANHQPGFRKVPPTYVLGLAAERSAVTKAAWLPEPNGFGRLGSESHATNMCARCAHHIA